MSSPVIQTAPLEVGRSSCRVCEQQRSCSPGFCRNELHATESAVEVRRARRRLGEAATDERVGLFTQNKDGDTGLQLRPPIPHWARATGHESPAASLVSPLSLAQQQRLAFAPSLDGVTAHLTCAAPAAPAAPAVSLLLSRTSLAARGFGGAALEEAAAWEAKQMEAARHAKELLLAEVERLSAARAKGKKGKKKKKNVGVGDTGAARLNEEMLCS
ncbi:hypothetical protein EMIHUDRAFT_213397 [Emiliania huxleyi CCMP1516]|uniref:Uncharacterized protein n=2 Tax=Emiliania huxleyi TaxID=2903 RepID=A0A0D3IN14_EMIH1|nr:hypothetical protein EMIHUDRAFT_213397 [Emiliania huxleyi CCMP1516]EOD12649.1 hypothetical protein EMIHUDRAFT_213397 [Emiliania huxleyi CCMP1516]|eukprot:XP_005765078.1 hypothetical protein EMIHUDRAFT_213397 [Emiliania huxleyi CCMP1516]